MSKLPIGEFLASVRKERGLTQRDVAEKLGISNRTLSSWEQGRAYPDVLSLSQLAEIYGVTADEILKGERALVKDAEKGAEEPSTAHMSGAIAEKCETNGDNTVPDGGCDCRAEAEKFIFKSKILTAVHACGALSFCMGLVCTPIVWLAILLIIIGACSVIISCALLGAFFERTAKTIGLRNGEPLSVASRESALAIGGGCALSLTVCGALWCAFGFMLAAFVKWVVALVVCFTPVCIGVFMLVGAAVGRVRDVQKYGGEAQVAALRLNRKLLFKCLGFTAIPVVLAISAMIFFTFWRETEKTVDFRGDRDGVVAYMHTVVLDRDNYDGSRPYGEYLLDMSCLENGVFVWVNDYFFAVRCVRDSGEETVDIFTAEAAEKDEFFDEGEEAVKRMYFATVRPVTMGDLRVYDVRYACAPAQYVNVSREICLEERDGEVCVIRTERTDYSHDGYLYGGLTAALSLCVCTAVYLIKRKKYPKGVS